MDEKPKTVWFYQRPMDGGEAFWDDYQHRNCLVIEKSEEYPFKPKQTK